MTTIFVLLILFQVKHFLADYPLQTPYMLQKFKLHGWVKPLAAHAGVHALGTLVIVGAWVELVNSKDPRYLLLPVLDFVIHFTMDRIKASPNLLGRYKALSASEFGQVQQQLDSAFIDNRVRAEEAIKGNRYFWWSLGLDQMVHHLTHYWVIFFLVR